MINLSPRNFPIIPLVLSLALLLWLATGPWPLFTGHSSLSTVLFAQQPPQSYYTPSYTPPTNTLNIGAGTWFCGNAYVYYPGGPLVMTSATNYVFLGLPPSCAPAFNATGFTAGVVPIAVVTMSGGLITSVLDQRTWFAPGPGVAYAASYAGADCGAKINSADAALTGSGEIWVDRACGTTISSAVNVSANHLVRFIQGGKYALRNIITLNGSGAGLAGAPVEPNVPDTTYGRTILWQDDNQNLTNMIVLNAAETTLSNLTVDGNCGRVSGSCTKNPTAGPNISVNAQWTKLENVNSVYSNSHGIVAGAATYGGNVAAAMHIARGIMLWNQGDGLLIQNSADIHLDGLEFENNLGYGIEGHDAGTVRIRGGDVGGNKLDGIYIYANNGSNANSAMGWLISGVQFGDNGGHDINIQGWNATLTPPNYGSLYNLIVGCSFVGGDGNGKIYADNSLKSYNTTDAIHIQDGGTNTIAGNTLFDTAGHGWYRYLIGIFESASGRESQDTVGLNAFNMNLSTGTAVLHMTASTIYTSNSILVSRN